MQEKAKLENAKLSQLWSIIVEISTRRVQSFYDRSLSHSKPADLVFTSSSPSSSSSSFDSHSGASVLNTNNPSTTSGGENFNTTNNPPSDYENNVLNVNYGNSRKYVILLI